MRLLRRFGLILLLTLLIAVATSAQHSPQAIRADRLGLTFISSIDHPAPEARYQRALLLGAGWNRWPLYWDRIERGPGQFDWSGYDRLVNDDVRHGLRVNAILLGRPGFHADGGAVANLGAPVFADGTDTPAPGKAINPGHPWASFVFQAVSRYRPGGLLAAQRGWGPGSGVTVWEVWNEPDLALFWTGGVEAYARLLKVAWLAAHAADPNAYVMFGGLAYGDPDTQNWLAETLAVIQNDPARAAHNWYMDAIAVHAYSYARRAGLVVRRVKQTLREFGLDRRVWLNESGGPVWDDYPGPVWMRDRPEERPYRLTMQQQAALVVLSTAYAWANGADVVLIHQLYDDCGDAAGNFPPHNGELCAGGAACQGDAYGLFRNERGEVCFSQHPMPGTPRPSAAAFYLMAQVFGTQPFTGGDVQGYETGGASITFQRPLSNQRIVILWNRRFGRIQQSIGAWGDQATLYTLDGQDYVLMPTDGQYTLALDPATPTSHPGLPDGEPSAVGGPPVILIETITRPPTATPTVTPEVPEGTLTAGPTSAPLTPQVGPLTSTSTPPPTLDPAFDTRPPVPNLNPLPVISPPTFTVSWLALDESGIRTYVVFYRVDGGEWQMWLTVTDGATEAAFTGEAGRRYDFALWAEDLAGNWSENVELTPQASTAVQG
jgi:hypothetical protein